MKQIKNYSDDRYKGSCLHCGSVLGLDSTSDHVPTKALLDWPLPENVHVVDTCRQCNNGFSSDEEYFAAFLGAAMSGSTEPNEQPFDAARSVLAGNAKLRREIEASKTAIPGTDGPPRTAWIPEIERIHRVVVKNARGHAFHELGRPLFHKPDQISIAPIETIDEERLADFLTVDADSDEAGRLFQSEVGHAFQLDRGHPTDLIPAGWRRLVGSVLVMSYWVQDGQAAARCLRRLSPFSSMRWAL